jgi:hypothetical protein
MSDPVVSGGTNTAPLVATFDDMRKFSSELAMVQTYLAEQALSTAGMATSADLLASAILSPLTAVDAEAKILLAAAAYTAQTARVTVLHLFVDGAIVTYDTADSALATAVDGIYFVGGFVVGAGAVVVGAVAVSAAVAYGVGVHIGTQINEVLDSAGDAVDAIGDAAEANPWLLSTGFVPGHATVLIATGVAAFASGYSPTEAAGTANQRLTSEFDALRDHAITTLFPDGLPEGKEEWEALLGEHTELVQNLIAFAPGILAGATYFLGPGINAALGAATGGPWPPLNYDQLVERVISGGDKFGVFNDDTGQPTVTQMPQSESPIVPTDLSSLFQGAGEIDRNGDPDGDQTGNFANIRIVDRVDADGNHHWIVQIPSTQNWSPTPGATPNDLSSDLAAEAQHQTVLLQAVTEAMAAAGISETDPVMLAGFSLGGITAGLMASDPTIQKDYNVTNVVTAGSSIANFDIPSTVDVLSFEHEGDLVPATDGAHNPATSNQVTVFDAPIGSGSPHDAGKYAVTAGDFQDSADPNAQYFTESSQQFFGDGDVTVSDYQATR